MVKFYQNVGKEPIRSAGPKKGRKKRDVDKRVTKLHPNLQSSSSTPWSVRLTSFLEELLLPYSPGPYGLCEANSRTLLFLVASYVGKRLLVMLRQQRFTQVGANSALLSSLELS